MLYVGVEFVAIHVLGDLVCGAFAIRSLGNMPVGFAVSPHLPV
jgi:nitrogenase subunit NifH